MFTSKFIVALFAFASSTNAFYYFEPGYRCAQDEACVAAKAAKRDAVVDANAALPGYSMRVVQRPSENGKPVERNVHKLAAKLARKYQGTATSQLENRESKYNVVSALAPTESNSAGLAQDGTDFSYFVEVGLGSESTPVYLLIDTGAGSSWVMGPGCTSEICKAHNSFGPKDSTTFKDLEEPLKIAYAKGSVTGTTGQDTLSFAGMKLPITIGIATTTSDDFAHFPIDGILGLSLAKSPSPDRPHVWESIVASKSLKANFFGLSMNRNADGPNDGEINFGTIDTSRYTGDLTYFPVYENKMSNWALTVGDVGFGKVKAGNPKRVGYLDTGTTYMFGPKDDVATLHSLIKGATSEDGSTWTVPCETTVPATITFGSNTYSISHKDWVSAKVNGVCTSNIYGIGVLDDDSWLLGDTFLKNVYSVYDWDQTRIGLAAIKERVAPTTSSSSPSSTGALSSPTDSTASFTTLATGSSTLSPTGTTQSNESPIESSGSTQATTAVSAPTTGPNPGLHGNESPAAEQPTADQTSSVPSATPTKESAGQPAIGFPTTLLGAVTLIALLLI